MANEFLIGIVLVWFIACIASFLVHKKIRELQYAKLLFAIITLFTGINFFGVALLEWPFVVADQRVGIMIAGGLSLVFAIKEILSEVKRKSQKKIRLRHRYGRLNRNPIQLHSLVQRK